LILADDHSYDSIHETGNQEIETYFTGKWHVNISPPKIFDHIGSIRAGMPKQTRAGYQQPVEGEEDQWSPYDKSQGGYWEGGKHWSEVVGGAGSNYPDAGVGTAEASAANGRPTRHQVIVPTGNQ